MKLHDLHPAPGARTARTRVGRGISAGKGKTAGRGTKGQRSRSGGNLPAWFEGGQTPIHMRVPKLRGFKRRGRIEYEVVNVGDIERAAEGGRLETIAQEDTAGEGAPKRRGRSTGDAALTVNAEILQGAGLVRDLRRPLKVLGDGDLTRKLFVVADAFTKSAREKIEAVGGTAMTLETPSQPTSAVGVGESAAEEGSEAPVATSGESPAEPEAAGRARRRPRDRGSETPDRHAAGEPARDAQAGSEDS